jgi:hypothetical protein
VLAAAAPAIFIRLAEALAIAIAFWRCALGATVLMPPALVRKDSFLMGRALYVGIDSGVALGDHCGFWISSFDYLSVAARVVTALLAWLVLTERPGLLTIVGGAVVLAGLYVLLEGRSAAGEPDP